MESFVALLKLMIIGSMLAFGFFSIWYYKKQNTQEGLGGPISKAKMLWLSYATFNYFFLSVFFLFLKSSNEPLFKTLLLFIVLIYFRALLQIILMYFIKKWSPIIGISYNIFCFLMIILSLFFNESSIIPATVKELPLFIFIFVVSSCLLTDSFYAYSFYKIIGKGTYGDRAIWYASEKDPRFNKINSQTSFMNIGFYLLFFINIILILFFI